MTSQQTLATYKCLLSGVKVEMYFLFKSLGITSGARFIFIFITPSTVLMMTLQNFLPCVRLKICFLLSHPRIGKRMCAESLSHWQNILQQKMIIPGEEIINLDEEVERSGKVNPQEKRELFIFSFIVLQVSSKSQDERKRDENNLSNCMKLASLCFRRKSICGAFFMSNGWDAADFKPSKTYPEAIPCQTNIYVYISFGIYEAISTKYIIRY